MDRIIWLILAIPVVVLDLWAVIDISKFSYKIRREKWFWTNMAIILPLVGRYFIPAVWQGTVKESRKEYD